MKKLKLGVIGVGGRGFGMIRSVLSKMKDVEIVAVCDEYQDRVERAQAYVQENCGNTPFGTAVSLPSA